MYRHRIYPRLKFLIRLAGCCLVSASALFWLVYLLTGNFPDFDDNPFNNAAFNHSVWLEDADCATAGNRRAGMTEDLLRHRLKRGMTVQEVKQLLDTPHMDADRKGIMQNRKRFSGEDMQAHRILVYYLGEELGGSDHGHEIDRAWLNLRFDERDRFTGGKVWLPPWR